VSASGFVYHLNKLQDFSATMSRQAPVSPLLEALPRYT
jgi:hypothetical protein